MEVQHPAEEDLVSTKEEFREALHTHARARGVVGWIPFPPPPPFLLSGASIFKEAGCQTKAWHATALLLPPAVLSLLF